MGEIAARPTRYGATLFRSRLEARWAAFFDLINYTWKYEPIDFYDWVPDFYVSFPCRHGECSGKHEFYAEVKPYYSIVEFTKHPVSRNDFGRTYGLDGGLRLGIDPSVAYAQFVHGSGGGVYTGYDLFCWCVSAGALDELWAEAGNMTRWKAPSLPPDRDRQRARPAPPVPAPSPAAPFTEFLNKLKEGGLIREPTLLPPPPSSELRDFLNLTARKPTSPPSSTPPGLFAKVDDGPNPYPPHETSEMLARLVEEGSCHQCKAALFVATNKKYAIYETQRPNGKELMRFCSRSCLNAFYPQLAGEDLKEADLGSGLS